MTDCQKTAASLMFRRVITLLILTAGFATTHAKVTPREPPPLDPRGDVNIIPDLPRPAMPLEAFFADPEFSQPQLSPSGRQLAVLHHNGESAGRNLKIIDLSTNEAQVLTSYDDHDVAWYVWVDEDRIAYRAEPDDNNGTVFGTEWLNVVDLSGGRPRITRFSKVRRGYSRKRRTEDQARWHSLRLLDPRPLDAERLLVAIRNEKLNPEIDSSGAAVAGLHRYSDVATLNINTGAIRRLARNPGNVYHWLVDPEGQARIALSLDDRLRVRILHRAGPDQQWSERYSFGYGEPGIWPLAFSDDPGIVYVLSNIGRDTRALYTYDLETGELGKQLFAHPEVDVSGLVLSRDGSRAIGARYETDRARIHYFDPYRQAIDTELSDALSEYEIDVIFSEDGESALVAAHNERNPGRYYHFDAGSGRLRELLRKREFLPEYYLSPTHAISLKARDGEQLHGFLTIPRGAQEAAPMVVIVHGGPHEVRDRWGFDPEVQFLANRGYTVLQVNFRGSSGYGRRFEQLGWGHWGQAIQDDIADAVRWAVDRRYGDASRVCIYGWSFGGYSALMNMALNPELYRCGVSFGGVTDLSALVGAYSPVLNGRQSFLDLVVGADNDQALLAQSSPINLVGEITAPVLVAHGLQDDIVPVSHFRNFVNALAIHEKPGEGLLLEDQGHGLNGETARFLFYRKLEAFLEQHLAIAPAGADPG